GEFGIACSVDEFLDALRHLIAIGEQHVTTGNHLLDGIYKSNSLLLDLFNGVGDSFESSSPFIGIRCLSSSVKKLGSCCQPRFGFGKGLVVVIEPIAQNGAPDRLKLGRDLL